MNLSNISSDLYSHPDYQYKKHIQNVADSFDNDYHKTVAYYHDVGKLSDDFQNYIRNPNKTKRTTHSLESALIYLFKNNLKISSVNFSIFFSILKHHGNLENVNDFVNDILSDEEYIKNNYPKLKEKIMTITHHLNFEIDYDLEEVCDIFDNESFVVSNRLNGLNNYFKIKEIFSKLIFSDKYEAIFKASYSAESFNKADKYIDKLVTLIKNKRNPLSKIRNQAREEAINNFEINKNKRIYLIEAPTGIGKTFIALQLALKIVKVKEKDRIINALPMTSIIDQTYLEYSKVIDESELLKFHFLTHSKKYIDNDEEKKSEEDQYMQKNDYLTSSWSLDNVIITTFNQLFDCFYSNKNKDLIKFWTLRNSVIILDEIQAIPRVLLQDISKAINYLALEFNIDFILMSATIPAIKHFLNPKITCELLDDKYFSTEFNNRYILSFNENINTLELLSEKIIEKSKNVGSILCVVNTKKISLKLYNELKPFFKDEEIILLSANFIPLHRKQIIKTVQKRLLNKQKTILISTQVVEAGVDLDFNHGFREFAPLSSIIQTAGRINREGKNNNSKLIITGKIGGSPYHTKDISYKEVKCLLSEEVEEKNILKTLKEYFEIVINKTSPDTMLIEKMENLEFENVIKIFNENFMQQIPALATIFIEVEDGLYNKFAKQHKEILEKLKDNNTSLEEKMILKLKLKELHKEISKYLIHVPKQEANYFPQLWENSDIYYCPYNYIADGSRYSIKTGWQSDIEPFI